MAKGYYKEVKKILQDNGCKKIRQSGTAHEIWESPHSNIAFTVSTNLKSRHTANQIMKDAGLGKKF